MDALRWIAVAVALAIAVAALMNARHAAARARAAGAEAERATRSARERAQSAEERNRVMDLVLGSMEEGVLLVASDDEVTFANPAVERLLGARPGTLAAVLPLGLQDAARRSRDGATPVSREVEVGAPGRWLRGSAIPVGDEGAVLLVVRDVTEARRLDAVRRDFVANASHELKTPVAAIQATAETITSAAHDDPQVIPRFAAQLERESLRLTRIVSDLLDLSRLESGSDLGEIVSLDAVIRDERERFEGAASEAGLTLAVDAGPVPTVQGSAKDLALMVRNLIDNAIRYTRPGGRVDISLRSAGEEVVLVVSDSGIGIPTRDLPRVFERFYRVDRARSRETGGTGLGLSIVKHVVDNHGGAVTARSELGRGSTFEVRLPVAA